MLRIYWPCLLAASAFMVWADTHTDEVPIILGFLLILSVVLGAAFFKQFLITWLVLGAAVPIAETLVNLSILYAPYPHGGGFPWAALVAYIPTLVGVALGAGARHFAIFKPL